MNYLAKDVMKRKIRWKHFATNDGKHIKLCTHCTLKCWKKGKIINFGCVFVSFVLFFLTRFSFLGYIRFGIWYSNMAPHIAQKMPEGKPFVIYKWYTRTSIAIVLNDGNLSQFVVVGSSLLLLSSCRNEVMTHDSWPNTNCMHRASFEGNCIRLRLER